MSEEEGSILERIAHPTNLEEETLTAVHLERFVKALWPEVATLPLRQRWAFILHLERDEVIAFVQHGCCTLSKVAEALETTPVEFAEWFAQLPVPDELISTRLQVSRRQVINLRKCARERLSRRLRMWAR
jgi:hypothetical protein